MTEGGRGRFVRVREQLIRQLTMERYPGPKLPAEEELARRLSTSVATVREVLRELDREGYITKRHGSGNYIHRSALGVTMRIDRTRDYGDLLREVYGDVGVQQSPCRLESLDPDTAARFGIAPGQPVVAYERVFLARGEPAIYTENRIPASRLVRPPEELSGEKTVMEFLREDCAEEPVQNVVRLIPGTAGDREALKLGLKKGTPLIAWGETFYNLQDEAVAFASSWFHPERVDMHLLVKR